MYLDLETTGLPDNPEARVELACWDVGKGIQTCWIEKEGWARLVADFDGVLAAHNASFELAWLLREGVFSVEQLKGTRVICTMLAEWVILGNRKDPLDLDSVAKRYRVAGKQPYSASRLAREVDKAKKADGLVDLSQVPWLEEYCKADVRACRLIWEKQQLLLQGMEHIVEQRFSVAPVLVEMQDHPLYLDVEKVKELHEAVSKEMREIDDSLADCGINLNSGKQLGEYLYGHSPAGLAFEIPEVKGKPALTAKKAPKTDEATMHLLQATTAKQEEFLSKYFRRNKLNSQLTKYLNFFLASNGVVRGEILQGRTGTHRLASSGKPVRVGKKKLGSQLQNIPREFKGLFQLSTDPDWVTVEADYEGLEFVVAADLCRDEQAVFDILNGKKEEGTDPHSNTARVLTENGQPTSRQDAKSSTFTPLYGGWGSTPAERIYVDYFRERYKTISRCQEQWAREVVASDGVLKTPYGMKFYFPHVKMNSRGFITGTTQVYNYPIQGFATGEIVPIALRLVWESLAGCDWAYVGLTVHDSIALACRKDKLSDLLEILKQRMLQDVVDYLKEKYNYEFTTKLGIEIKAGSHLGQSDCGEWKYSILDQ